METLTCTACKETKSVSEFYKRRDNPPSYRMQCKPCFKKAQESYTQSETGKENARKKSRKWRQANLDKAAQLQRSYYHRHKERFYDYELKARYGLAYGSYRQMLDGQGGGCAICQRKPKETERFHVDHCHNSGKVRGLLCGNCNHLLGKAADNPEILSAAISYLAKG